MPLLTVELGFHSEFELQPADADILVQIPGQSVMWQKERLLNVALSKLPSNADPIAWIDADVLLARHDWPEKAIHVLKTFDIAQLFDNLFDVSPHENPEALIGSRRPDGASIASLVISGAAKSSSYRPTSTVSAERCAIGFAWVAVRGLLEKHGFYDAMILGGGDRAMMSAAFGRFDDFVATAHLSECRTRHYLAWAYPFFNDVRARVGYVEGDLLHLWHGHLRHRRYLERHRLLARCDFNPNRDIAVDPAGAWVWNSSNEPLHACVENYFRDRREDG